MPKTCIICDKLKPHRDFDEDEDTCKKCIEIMSEEDPGNSNASQDFKIDFKIAYMLKRLEFKFNKYDGCPGDDRIICQTATITDKIWNMDFDIEDMKYEIGIMKPEVSKLQLEFEHKFKNYILISELENAKLKNIIEEQNTKIRDITYLLKELNQRITDNNVRYISGFDKDLSKVISK